MSQTLQIVSSALLVSFVGENTGVPGSPGEPFSLSKFDVLVFGVHELLGESKIDDENSVGLFFMSNGEIIRFYVSVDDSPRVDVLDSFYHLVSQHQNCLY